jgi:hypothetical protein
MAALAEALMALFVSLVSYFSLEVGKRVAVGAALLAAFLAITLAFFGALKDLAQVLQLVVPPSVLTGAAWFLPDNTEICLSTYFSAYVMRWVYDWHIETLKYKGWV